MAMLLIGGSLFAQDITADTPSDALIQESPSLIATEEATQQFPVGLKCGCSGDTDRDRKIAAFGFSFGLNRSNLQFGEAQENGDQIVNGLGYRLGVVSELRLGKRWVISPKADLSFNAGQLNQSNTEYSVSASSLELMGHLKYRFAKSNFSPYVLAGPNYRLPLSTRDENSVPTRNDVAIDVGLGLDIPLIGFKISPEVRYSYGLTNISTSDAFSDLNHHNIAVSLIFTGK
ncbi:MAG: hypothetical protein Crog4KO_16360 [Crocinitomicaceae bacterium]